MSERIVKIFHGFRTIQERQDRRKQELANAIGNLRFLQERVLSNQQVKDLLATNTTGVIVLSPADPALIIANRDREYGGIEIYPEKSLGKLGPLGLFIDLSKRFGRFVEIDEMLLRSEQDNQSLFEVFFPDNLARRLGELKREEIVEKITKTVEEVRGKIGITLEGLLTA